LLLIPRASSSFVNNRTEPSSASGGRCAHDFRLAVDNNELRDRKLSDPGACALVMNLRVAVPGPFLFGTIVRRRWVTPWRLKRWSSRWYVAPPGLKVYLPIRSAGVLRDFNAYFLGTLSCRLLDFVHESRDRLRLVKFKDNVLNGVRAGAHPTGSARAGVSVE